MGYSYTAKAGDTLDAIRDSIAKAYPGLTGSNSMPDGGFWETGREQPDGAITGTVWKPWPQDTTRVVRRGGFRIEPDGKVSRFPGLSTKLIRSAEKAGAAKYSLVHERMTG